MPRSIPPHPVEQSVGQTVYAQDLRRTQYSQHIWDPDLTIRNDPYAYRTIYRNPRIRQAIEERKNLVGSRKWIITSGSSDKEILRAKIDEELIKKINGFSTALIRHVDADLEGASYSLIKGSYKMCSIAGLPPAMWWVPEKLKDIDKRRFRQSINDQGDFFWEISSRFIGKGDALGWEPLLPSFAKMLLVHRHDDVEQTYGFGRSLFEAIYSSAYAIQVLEEIGLQGVSRRAHGIIAVGIDEVAAGNSDKNTIATEYLEAWKKTETQHFMAHSNNDKIQMLELSGVGHEWLTQQLEYHHRSIRALLLGSSAINQEEDDQNVQSRFAPAYKRDIIDTSAEMLAESIDYSLMNYLQYMNLEPLAKFGLLETPRGRFNFMEQKDDSNKENIEIDKGLVGMGIPLSKSDTYERYSRKPPKDETDSIIGTIKETTTKITPGGTEIEISEKIGDDRN